MKLDTSYEEFENDVAKQVNELGYDLVEFKTGKQNKNKRISVVIYNENRITHKDCSIVSSTLSDFFDDKFDSYYIEVSSPGIERNLKTERELRTFKGKKVKITFVDDNKIYDYIIKDYKNNILYLKNENNDELEIVLDKISKIKLFS